MDLQRLERFVVLANEKNFSRAAEHLNIPQSHLSRQIKQLEKELGVELFDRKRPLALTVPGAIFLEEVDQILVQVQRAKISAQRANQGEIGRLTVGISHAISNTLLPDVLYTFQQQFPGVELELQEMLVKDSRQKLQQGQIDVDFENLHNLQDVDEHHFLSYEIIRREPLILVLPATHRFADRRQVSLKELAADPFILPSPTLVPALYHLIYTFFDQVNIYPTVVQTATWMTTILSLVSGGVGIALLPANVIALQRTGVVYREPQEPSPIFQLAVVWRQSNQSKVLNNFLEIVRQVSRSHPGHPTPTATNF